MIVRIIVLLICVAIVSSVPQRCSYQDGQYSPFYWQGMEHICTKSICEQRPELNCYVPQQTIDDVIRTHEPEDIKAEVMAMSKYFNTHFPPPLHKLDYKCTGLCNSNSQQQRLERIFTDVKVFDEYTYQYKIERHMCIVIGPDIYYQQCGGKCTTTGSTRVSLLDHHCVPDVTVSVDIWVYCPAIVYKKCNKVRFDVPLSCSCKKLKCKRGVQIPTDPIINPGGPLNPGIPVGTGGVPFPGLK